MKLFAALLVFSLPILSPVAAGTPEDILPIVVPTPQKVAYSDDLFEMTGLRAEIPADMDDRIRKEIDEIREEFGWKDKKDGNTLLRLRLDPSTEPALGKEGYELIVDKESDIVRISIAAPRPAGLFYGLQSFVLLSARRNGSWHVRKAQITDYPHFATRGLIMSANDEETLRFMKRYKLNALMHANYRGAEDLSTVKDLLARCDRQFVEFIALEGVLDMLTQMNNVEGYYRKRAEQGIRAITINFDDLRLKAGEGGKAARTHMEIVKKIHADLKEFNKDMRIIFCPVPYGGTADTGFVRSETKAALEYLARVGDELPPDIEVFWTGNSGYATRIDGKLADQYGGYIKRKPFIWENKSLAWCNNFRPLTARSPDLYKHTTGYLANVNEAETKDGVLARPVFITIADYLWNSGAYDRNRALDRAFQSLISGETAEVRAAWASLAGNKERVKAAEAAMARIRNARFRDRLAEKLK